MGDIVIGVDPGGTSAWAAVSMGNVVERAQGEMRSNTRSLVVYARTNRERIRAFGVEDQYIGGKVEIGDDGKPRQNGSAHSSKVVCQRQGFVIGALFIAGFDELTSVERLWMPLPSSWRKEFGLNVGKRGSIDAATRQYVAARMRIPIGQVGEHWAVAACIAWALWETHVRNNARREHIAASGGKT